jgi:hypothetical protein
LGKDQGGIKRAQVPRQGVRDDANEEEPKGNVDAHWAIIRTQVNIFHGYHVELEAREDSGTSPVDLVTAASLLASIFMRLYMLDFYTFF